MSIWSKLKSRKFLSILTIVIALIICVVGVISFIVPSWVDYKEYYDTAVAEREHQKYINSLPLELVDITATLRPGSEFYDNGKAAPTTDDFEVMAHFTEKGQARDTLLTSGDFTINVPTDFAQKGGTVTVSYTWTPEAAEGETATPVTKTADVPVSLTHVALKKLTMTSDPNRVYYSDAMPFSLEGAAAVAEYNDGSVKELEIKDLTAETSGALAAGTTSVKVAYNDGESEVTADVPVTVVAASEYEDGPILSINARDKLYLAEGDKLAEADPDIYAHYANGNRLLIEDKSVYTVTGNVETASFMKNCMVTVTLNDGSGVNCRIAATVRNGMDVESAQFSGEATQSTVSGYTVSGDELVADKESSVVLENFKAGDKLTFAANSESIISTAFAMRMADVREGDELSALDLGDVMSVRVNGRWLPIGGKTIERPSIEGSENSYVFEDISLPSVALVDGANEIEITFIADADIAIDRVDVSTEFEGNLYSSVAECILADGNNARDLVVEKFKDWHRGTSADGTISMDFALGMCAGERGLYVLYNEWNSQDARASVVVLYDAETGDRIAASALTDANISESSSGLCAYDGKVIVFYKDGTQGYVEESAFTEGCTFSDYDGFNFEGLETAVIRDVSYSEKKDMFAVLAGNTAYIFDGEMKAVTSFGLPSESYGGSTNSLKRMTGDDEYLYFNYTVDGNYEPLIRIYDWNGNFRQRAVIPNTVEMMGKDIVTAPEGTNTQALAVFGGDLYVTVIKFGKNANGQQSLIIKASLPEVNAEKEISLAVGDYVAVCDSEGVDPLFDVAPIPSAPFGSRESQMTMGGVSDGRYLYVSVNSTARDSDNNVIRRNNVYKIDAATSEQVAVSATYDTLVRSDTDNSRMFIKDGKLYAFGADNTIFEFDLETFEDDCTPVVAEGLPFDEITGAGKTITSGYWNEAARRFVLATSDNYMYIISESGEMLLDAPVKLGAKTSVSGDEKYIYANRTANNTAGATMSLPVTVYDWETGKIIAKEIAPSGFFPDAKANTYNVQTVFAHNGDLYATICSWGAVTSTEYLWKISTNYAVFDTAAESISVTAPTKTEYVIGESFDPAGMTVTVEMTDGSQITPEDYSYDTAPFTQTGEKDVTISYTAGVKTVSTTVKVTVRLPENFGEYAAACEAMDVTANYSVSAVNNKLASGAASALVSGGVSDGTYLYVSINSPVNGNRSNTVYKVDPVSGDVLAASKLYETGIVGDKDNSRMFIKDGKLYAVGGNNKIFEFDLATFTNGSEPAVASGLPFSAVTNAGKIIKSVLWNETESKWAVSTNDGLLYILSADGTILKDGVSLGGSSVSISGTDDVIYAAPSTNGKTDITVKAFDWNGANTASLTLPVIEGLSSANFNIQAVYPHGDSLILNICTWSSYKPSSYLWQVTFDNSVFTA